MDVLQGFTRYINDIVDVLIVSYLYLQIINSAQRDTGNTATQRD